MKILFYIIAAIAIIIFLWALVSIAINTQSMNEKLQIISNSFVNTETTLKLE